MNKEKNLDWMSASPEDIDLVGRTSIEKDATENQEETLEELLEKFPERGIFMCEKDFLIFSAGDELIARKINDVLEVKKAENGKAKKGERRSIISRENINEFFECFSLKSDKVEKIPTKETKIKNEDVKSAQESEINMEKFESDMYEQLYKRLEKEYDEADSKEAKKAYIEKLRGDLEKFTTGDIDKEDEEFLKNFGFNKKDKKNKKIILESYKEVISKILNELKGIKEAEEISDEDNIETDEMVNEENLEEQRQEVIEKLERLGDKGYIDKNKEQELKEELEEIEKIIDEKIEKKEYTVDDIAKAQREAEAVKSEIEKIEKKWNNLEDFLKRDIGAWKEYYNESLVKESAVASIKDTMKNYTVNEEYMKSFLENVSNIKFTKENKERLSDLASKLYGDLLKELESEPEPEPAIAPEMPEEPEIKSEEEKRREAEKLKYEKIAGESRDKMWNQVTETNKEIADNLEMADEDMEKTEDKRSKRTVRAVMSDVGRGSYEEIPKERGEWYKSAGEALGAAFKEMQIKHEREKIKLTKAQTKAVENFGTASDEGIKRVVSEKNNQQTGESKKGWRGAYDYILKKLPKNKIEENEGDDEIKFKEIVALEFLEVIGKDGLKEALEDKGLKSGGYVRMEDDDVEIIAKRLSDKNGGNRDDLEEEIRKLKFRRKDFEGLAGGSEKKDGDLNYDDYEIIVEPSGKLVSWNRKDGSPKVKGELFKKGFVDNPNEIIKKLLEQEKEIGVLDVIFSKDEISRVKNVQNPESLIKIIEDHLFKFDFHKDSNTATKDYHKILLNLSHALSNCYDSNKKEIDLDKLHKIDVGFFVLDKNYNENADNYFAAVFEKLGIKEEENDDKGKRTRIDVFGSGSGKEGKKQEIYGDKVKPMEITKEMKGEIRKVFKQLDGLDNEERENIKKSFIKASGLTDREVLSLWSNNLANDFVQRNKEAFRGVTIGQIIEIMGEDDGKVKNEKEEKEDKKEDSELQLEELVKKHNKESGEAFLDGGKKIGFLEKKINKEKEKFIENCKSFGELDSVLDRIDKLSSIEPSYGLIKGTKKDYEIAEIKSLINRLRMGEIKSDGITGTLGLNKKVVELIIKEKSKR